MVEEVIVEEAMVDGEIIQKLNQPEVATVDKTKNTTWPPFEIILKINHLFLSNKSWICC